MINITANDLIKRWRPLSTEEINMANTLIADVNNAIHVFAHDRGMDLDVMLADYEYRNDLYIAVVCDIVKREMCNNTEGPAMSQYSQSVMGYNVQGTFLTPGGGLFIKNSELKMLGLMGQKARAVELYGNCRNTNNII